MHPETAFTGAQSQSQDCPPASTNRRWEAGWPSGECSTGHGQPHVLSVQHSLAPIPSWSLHMQNEMIAIHINKLLDTVIVVMICGLSCQERLEREQDKQTLLK